MSDTIPAVVLARAKLSLYQTDANGNPILSEPVWMGARAERIVLPREILEIENTRSGAAYDEYAQLTAQQGDGPSGTGVFVTRRFSVERDASGQATVAQMTETRRAAEDATTSGGKLRKELDALTRDFAANTLKVARWAASVMVVYKSAELAGTGLRVMAETGLQTARLDQVFRGVGGSAQELAQDTIGLAAAEGRARQEAMEAAITWSRLGLTRREVNEGVRQSLVAANVAELDAGAATNFLLSIMAGYDLQVRDLSKTLGLFNAVTNTTKATNKELFQGLAQTGSVAKEAQLPLEELVGMMAATVQKSGQTGSRIGTAIKSTIVALSNPETQKLLRQQFRLEVTQEGGAELQPMNEVLAKLYVTYSKLNDKRREELLVTLAGKTQANRLAAILDAYVLGQVRAVNAQLNLNSAESENAKIKATLISQWQGLKSAMAGAAVSFDRWVGFTPKLAQGLRYMRNVVQVAAFPGDELREFKKLHPEGRIAPEYQLFNRIGGVNPVGLFNTLMHPSKAMAEFNRAAETLGLSTDVVTQKLEPFERAIDQADARAKAAIETLNLLDTVRRTLLGQDEEKRADIVKDLSELGTLKNPDKFKLELGLAVNEKDQAAVDRVVTEQLEYLRERSKAEYQEKQRQIKAEIEFISREIESQPKTETGKKNIEEFQNRLDQLTKNVRLQAKAWIENDQALIEAAAATLKVATNLERAKQALDMIKTAFAEMPAFGLSGRVQNEIAGLEAQERYLRRHMDRISADKELNPVQKDAALRKLEPELDKVQAELGAKRSPEIKHWAAEADRRRIIGEISRAGGEAFDFGISRAGRFANEERGLKALIAVKEEAARLAGNEEEKQSLLLSVEAHKVQLAELLVEKEKERWQVLRDEFELSRKLVTAGPAELLRKIVAERMVQKGVQPGQFLAMGPEMRQEVVEANARRQDRAFMMESPLAGDVWRRFQSARSGERGAWGSEVGGRRSVVGESWLPEELRKLLAGMTPPDTEPVNSSLGSLKESSDQVTDAFRKLAGAATEARGPKSEVGGQTIGTKEPSAQKDAKGTKKKDWTVADVVPVGPKKAGVKPKTVTYTDSRGTKVSYVEPGTKEQAQTGPGTDTPGPRQSVRVPAAPAPARRSVGERAKAVWNWVNTPLPELLEPYLGKELMEMAGPFAIPGMGSLPLKLLSTRMSGKAVSGVTGLPRRVTDPYAGLWNASQSFAKSLTSPLGLATLPFQALRIPGYIGEGLSALFGAHAAIQVPGQVKEGYATYKAGDWEGAAEAVGGVVGSAAMVGMSARHVRTRRQPPVIKDGSASGTGLSGTDGTYGTERLAGPPEGAAPRAKTLPGPRPPRIADFKSESAEPIAEQAEPPRRKATGPVALGARILERAGVEPKIAERFARVAAPRVMQVDTAASPNLEEFRAKLFKEFEASGLVNEGAIPRRNTNPEAHRAAGASNPEELARLATEENAAAVRRVREQNERRMAELEKAAMGQGKGAPAKAKGTKGTKAAVAEGPLVLREREFIHGSPIKGLTTLQPGTMMSKNPAWAAGYTTRTVPDVNANKLRDEFVGQVYNTTLNAKKPVFVRSMAEAESMVLEQGRKALGREARTLKEAAEAMAKATGFDAIVAKNERGVQGAIALNPYPVEAAMAPQKALQGFTGFIPDNIKEALARAGVKLGAAAGVVGAGAVSTKAEERMERKLATEEREGNEGVETEPRARMQRAQQAVDAAFPDESPEQRAARVRSIGKRGTYVADFSRRSTEGNEGNEVKQRGGGRDYSVIAPRKSQRDWPPFGLRKPAEVAAPPARMEDLERFKAMSDTGEELTRQWMERSGLTDPSAGGTGLGRTGGADRSDRTDINRRVKEHWQRRLKEAMAMPEGDLKQDAVKTAEDALRDAEQRASGADRANVAERVREHWQRRLKEALAMPEGDLRQESVKAAEDALREWGASGTGKYGAGRSGVIEWVRAHWRKRLREAMDMSNADPQLKQQAIEAAEQALKVFEERQKGGTRTADRVRAHWQRRLREAMDMSDVDPQLKQEAVEAAEQALRDYEQRAKSQEQRATGRGRSSEFGGRVPPDWMNRWKAPTPVGPEQMGGGQASDDGRRASGRATGQSGLEEMAASAYRAGQALSALVMVAEYVGQIGTAVGQLQAKVSMFELPRAGQGAPYLPQAHG